MSAQQGTESLLALASELQETSQHVQECYDLGRGARLMLRASEALKSLAHLDPDIQVEHSEN